MDCSYVASGTARLVSHSDDYQLAVIAMQIAVVRRLATRIAEMSWDQPNPTVFACAATARTAVASYDEVLTLFQESKEKADDQVDPDEPVS